MDQDLRSRIKAAAQERGIDPEIAVKFAQAESSLNPNAKAKTSSASGLYQVINKTWKEYGGGDKKDVNEQIRVGTDVIASNQEKFKRKFNREPSAAELYAYHVLGPTGAPQLLRADPSTPMEQVVSPEALKANSVWKGKTVGQVLATYEKKVGGSGKAPASTEQRNTRMRPTGYSFEPLTRMDLEQLGPNYQAAMASIALADTNDSDVPTAEQLADMEEDQVLAQDESMVEEEPMMSTAAIRDIGNTQSQPILMAKGGEARKMMDAVYRAEGSPVYGEISMGDFSGDTRQQLKDALTKRGRATTKEDLKILSRLPVEAASNVESFTRGSVAALPGMVGDVESAFRTDPKNQVFPTTEKILKSIPRLTPTNERSAGFEEIGTYDIGLPGKAIAKGVSKVPKLLKAAAPVAAAMALKAAPAAQPMYAVKPTGGVFYPQGSGSQIDQYLDRIVNKLGKTDIPGKDAGTVADFIRNKGYKYLTTTFGSGKDPIREAIYDGRLAIMNNDAENIKDYALAAAREGHPNAMKDVEKAYDALTQLRGEVVMDNKNLTTMAREAKLDAAKEAEVAKMIKEGVDPDHINYTRSGRDIDELSRTYGPDSQKMLADILSGKLVPETGAQKSIQKAVEKGEPIYDLGNVYPNLEVFDPKLAAEGIATIPVKDLQNMTFPEALIRGMQNTLLDRNGDAVIAALEKGNSIPKKFYAEGVTPIKGLEKVGWVTVDTPFAVKLEGAAMKHSVDGYAEKGGYGIGGREAFLEGKAKVYSLRPDMGKPVTTVEARMDPDGLFLSQVKGPFNSVPTPEEKQKVFELFDMLRPYKFKPAAERYRHTRGGERLPDDEAIEINWGEEYANYQKYLNKEIE
jgi:hypothetical protein